VTKVTDENQAILTHHDVGREFRHAMERIHQKKPEDLPRATDLRKLLEEKRRKSLKQLQEQQKANEGGQDTLF
jgi:hypothetical protein